MKTGRWLCAALLVLPSAIAAQTPRGVSPRFSRVVQRADTTVVAWILARGTTDLANLAAQVTARGGHIRFTSQFVHGVSAEVPGNALQSLARLEGVVRVQPVATYFRRPDSLTALPPYRPTALPLSRPTARADTLYGANFWAMTMLRVHDMHTRGLFGAGVRIAMFDAGFNTLHPYMATAHVVAQYDFVNNDSVVRDQPGEIAGEMFHGTGTWSLIAARAPGILFGVAPDADFLLAKTEVTTSETRVEEDRWVAAVEWAVGLNAQIISSSLGYISFDNGFTYSAAQMNGDFAVTTIAADSAAARGVLVVISAGNDGPSARTLSTPADGDSVVAVGAVDSLGRIAIFSSRGPTADGRIKPEVSAPGVAIVVANTDSGNVRGNGTSYAAPLVAGVAALVQGSRTGPAVDLREGLMQGSSRWETPDNILGYGIPDGIKVYAFPQGVHAIGPFAGTLNTVTPTFKWDAGTPPAGIGANIYLVRMWSDSARQHILIDTVLTTTTFTITRPLVAGTRIFWRVIVGSTTGAAESTALQGPVLVPNWATMLTLGSPQGATIRDSLPRFVWQSPGAAAPPGPFTYDVDVYPASRTPLQAVASARGLTDTTFQPTVPLEKNVPFRWRVVAHLGSDSQVITSPGTFLVADASTPVATVLFQNFPNPFPNPSTGLTTSCIWFDIAQAGEVRLEIFDLRGRLVRRLSPGPNVPSPLPAGRYGRPAGDAPGTCDPRFSWDGRDQMGQFVRAGVYLYRLTAPGFQDSKHIVYAGP